MSHNIVNTEIKLCNFSSSKYYGFYLKLLNNSWELKAARVVKPQTENWHRHRQQEWGDLQEMNRQLLGKLQLLNCGDLLLLFLLMITKCLLGWEKTYLKMVILIILSHFFPTFDWQTKLFMETSTDRVTNDKIKYVTEALLTSSWSDWVIWAEP